MSSLFSYQPLIPAEPALDARGLPYSERYGDVYHSPHGPWGQIDYVFLRGNGLPGRWRGRQAFTVCETGFGLGLNFLGLWRAWRADPARSRRLHMVSFEAHPWRHEDLARQLGELAGGDDVRPLAEALLRQWPPLLPGVHRLEFEQGAVTLTLVFGDAASCLPRVRFGADAFFLDGFKPKRNPAMWTPELLQALAAHAMPGATLATWCSAGVVRRSLRDAGFDVEREDGFGTKTHMVAGRWTGVAAPGTDADAGSGASSGESSTEGPGGPLSDNLSDSLDRSSSQSFNQGFNESLIDRVRAGYVLIVGAGLAGAGVAHALALRGVAVMVVDAPASSEPEPGPRHGSLAEPGAATADQAPTTPHGGHLAAALTPLVSRDDNVRARLSRAGSQRALARWLGLPAPAAPVHCGTLQLTRDRGRGAKAGAATAADKDLDAANESMLATLGFPAEWVRAVDAKEAAGLAGVPVSRGGLYFGDGLLVQPQPLIDALLATPGITRRTASVRRLEAAAAGWVAEIEVVGEIEGEAGGESRPGEAAVAGLVGGRGGKTGKLPPAAAVVLANAAGTPAVLAASGLLARLPRVAQMHALAGEVTRVDAELLDGGPRCIIGGEGYLLPAVDGGCVAGSTYVHGASSAQISAAGQGVCLDKAAGLLSGPPAAALTHLARQLAGASAGQASGDPGGSSAPGDPAPGDPAQGNPAPVDQAQGNPAQENPSNVSPTVPSHLPGWAGWRAVLAGRLPAIGPVPDAPGLLLATGYASRGLSWSALAGDIIAAILCGEPLPLEDDLLAEITPR